MAFTQRDSQIKFEECLLKLVVESNRFSTLENLELLNRCNLRIQQTALFPSIAANGGYTLFVQNSSIAYNENVLPPSTIQDARSTALSGSITAGVDVVQFGQAAFRSQATSRENEALAADYRGERNAFLREAAKLYSDCVISKQTIRQLEQQLELSLGLVRIAETGLRSGQSDSLSFLQATINAEKDRIALRTAQLDWIKLIDQLKVILNQDVDQSIELEENIDAVVARVSEWEARATKGEVWKMQAAEFRLKQARNEHIANYFSFVPSITFFGGYSISDQRFQNGIFARNKGFGPTYGLTLSYSFGQVKNAFHQEKITSLSMENRRLELERIYLETQIEQKHLHLTTVHLQDELAGRNLILKTAKRTLEMRIVAYQSGKVGINDVREAQLELMAAEIGLNQAKTALIQAKLEEIAQSTDLNKMIQLNTK